MANKDNYLSILMAQVECINEQLDGVKRERLSVTCTETDYRIEKILPKPRYRSTTSSRRSASAAAPCSEPEEDAWSTARHR